MCMTSHRMCDLWGVRSIWSSPGQAVPPVTKIRRKLVSCAQGIVTLTYNTTFTNEKEAFRFQDTGPFYSSTHENFRALFQRHPTDSWCQNQSPLFSFFTFSTGTINSRLSPYFRQTEAICPSFHNTQGLWKHFTQFLSIKKFPGVETFLSTAQAVLRADWWLRVTVQNKEGFALAQGCETPDSLTTNTNACLPVHGGRGGHNTRNWSQIRRTKL